MNRNARKRIPPRDPARRRLYYALRNKAKRAASMAQHRYLNGRADALMEWVDVDSDRCITTKTTPSRARDVARRR